MLEKLIPIILVLIGSIGLIISLKPTKEICNIEGKQACNWKTLGALIVFFIIGYFFFVFMLLRGMETSSDYLVSLILCLGGFFVALVVRMSFLTINNVKRISALERHRALHDNLTDLPNRVLVLERIDHAIADAGEKKESVTIAVVDINRFRQINDALGHHYGDYLLQLITPRLCQSLRGIDTVGRIGSDEFALVLPDADYEIAEKICRKLLKIMDEPFNLEGDKYKVDISIGLAFYPEHGIESEALLQHADIALHEAKRSGKKIVPYSVKYDQHTFNRLMLAGKLREAINRDELSLFFQPIISIKDDTVYGVEALIRWSLPGEVDSILSAEDIIALAEQVGLINSLTQWVIDNALRQKSIWKENGIDLAMSINLSIIDLRDLSFPGLVKALIDKWQVEPDEITLEITESSMMLDPEVTREVIERLKELGLHIAIDDFGTGYSSLSYLKHLPASEIKIDKSFVLDMLVDENDAAIVRSTIDLARNMGVKVVAEGVEKKEIMAELITLGCNSMQGHYLGKPLPAGKLFESFENKQWKFKKINGS